MRTSERTLVIECATEACSIALIDSGTVVAADHRILGRGHAEHLVPMIAELPDRGRAETILVSLGPGSFTGVRIGVAVAGALAIAWKAKVAGYPTLALVAAMALKDRTEDRATVCMVGGHGEWFIQDFGPGGMAQGDLVSLTPAAAAERPSASLIAGSRAEDLARLVGAEAIQLLPEARFATLLDQTALIASAVPIYGRGPDARLPG
ncbi:tRNA (adenosine(37)-N6)-threonylcarbamoyltransferase complex dimerization subunit type 1 TsaB [Tsuneonella sp. HG249]